MTSKALDILGIGTALPPSRSVREVALAQGGNDAGYRGWERACQGQEDDHPSTMGTRALQEALEQSGVNGNDLSLVIFSGTSRDYPPSWSVSNEIMRLSGATEDCIGFDMTAGCLATLEALELARTWLGGRGGGIAAIVAGERWSQTVDYRDPTGMPFWAYGDSGGAFVVSVDRHPRPRARFLGADFRSNSEANGRGVMVRYGGTREPVAPFGVSPLARRAGDMRGKEITKTYRKGYGDAYAAVTKRFGITPVRAVCNQLSPPIVSMIGAVLGLEGRCVITGDEYGHLGGVDIVVGLSKALADTAGGFPIALGASTSYGFGIGIVTAP